MRPLYGVVRLLEVSAAGRVLMYGNGKFNSCISCCPFSGQWTLFGLSAFGGFTVNDLYPGKNRLPWCRVRDEITL